MRSCRREGRSPCRDHEHVIASDVGATRDLDCAGISESSSNEAAPALIPARQVALSCCLHRVDRIRRLRRQAILIGDSDGEMRNGLAAGTVVIGPPARPNRGGADGDNVDEIIGQEGADELIELFGVRVIEDPELPTPGRRSPGSSAPSVLPYPAASPPWHATAHHLPRAGGGHSRPARPRAGGQGRVNQRHATMPASPSRPRGRLS